MHIHAMIDELYEKKATTHLGVPIQLEASLASVVDREGGAVGAGL